MHQHPKCAFNSYSQLRIIKVICVFCTTGSGGILSDRHRPIRRMRLLSTPVHNSSMAPPARVERTDTSARV
jgi:hypothetical protein